MTFSDLARRCRMIRKGKLVALGVSSARGVPAAHGNSAARRRGRSRYDAVSWQMIWAAGTSKDLVARLNREFREIMRPATCAVFREYRHGPNRRSGAGRARALFSQSEIARWAKVVEQQGRRD